MERIFLEYFDSSVPLEAIVEERYDAFDVAPHVRRTITPFLDILRQKDVETYRHSLRVGIIGSRIAEYRGMDPKSSLYGGLLHDTGKCMTDLRLLRKREAFDENDLRMIEEHVMDGYRMLRGVLDFTADVIVRHHSFQARGYPKTLPDILHPYGPETFQKIQEYGRQLAMTDFYDAAHRMNGKGTGVRTGENIRQLMFEAYSDRREQVNELYEVGIFTTKTA
ncbi:MAG: HD domain-containing protein [Candidatus Moranbacteria bacterium]|nr:HD domain-containing protein [Candidatus Moranbacteria bacterium]